MKKRLLSGDGHFAVLIVEDNARQLKVLTDIFRAKNLQPFACLTGKEALEACRTHAVHVAVIDLRLPDIDGLELLRQLKQLTPDMKVIIHTGYATLESAMEAVNREAFAYVQKEGDVEELLAQIHRAFHAYLAGYSEQLEREVERRTEQLSVVNKTLRQEITVRENAEREVKKQSRNLQQLSTELMNAQEAERQKISRELHDVMGQSLTAIGLNLAALEKETVGHLSDTAKERLAESRELLDQILEQVRELSRTLRPSLLDDLGLVPALRWYVKRYAARADINVMFQTSNLEERVPPCVETAVFRIIQEALTNVTKHACATSVQVVLERQGTVLKVSVSDNGRGFERPQHESGGEGFSAHGIGLLGMQERVSLLKGEFGCQSAPGQGTTLIMTIPLRDFT